MFLLLWLQGWYSGKRKYSGVKCVAVKKDRVLCLFNKLFLLITVSLCKDIFSDLIYKSAPIHEKVMPEVGSFSLY